MNPSIESQASRWITLAGLGVALLCGGAVWHSSVATAAGEPTAQDDARAYALADELSAAFERVAESIAPSMVSVRAVKTVKLSRGRNPFLDSPLREFFGDNFQFGVPDGQDEFSQEGVGSGFVIRKNGYILTNNHVVGGSDEVSVVFTDGREMKAKVVGADAKTDVAVIKIDAEDLQPARLGESDSLRVGQWVVAAGSPFGLASTITSGIISAKGRTRVGLTDYEDFIQTDCAINPGNSGGPLINLRGEVIGVNTAIFTRSGGSMGIGFAIPINLARNIADKLVADGKVVRGYLGVYIQDLTEDLSRSFDFDGQGVLVGQVQSNGPADSAGMKEGDIILELEGEKSTNAKDLRLRVADLKPGTEIDVRVWRDGKEKKLALEIGELPSDETRLAEVGDSMELGMELRTLTADLCRQLGLSKVIRGVAVVSVKPASVAERAGLQPRDVIVRVKDEDVRSTEEFDAAMRDVDLERGVRLVVQRGDVRSFAILRKR